MSRGLGQGELLEVPPTRRLLVSAGCTSWWGVDPSTKRVAIGTVDVDGIRGVSQRPFPAGDTLQRLGEIYGGTVELAEELLRAGLAPGVVVVERPGAPRDRSLNFELHIALGAIIAALDVATGAELKLVVPGSWKAVACGHGGIRKPKPSSREEYQVLTWARSTGYRGSSWDEADAWGIADYARRTWALGVR